MLHFSKRNSLLFLLSSLFDQHVSFLLLRGKQGSKTELTIPAALSFPPGAWLNHQLLGFQHIDIFHMSTLHEQEGTNLLAD